MDKQCEAILVVSFGGPESREDVIPFLENVLRGKSVPRERLLAVAEHYYHFDGKSPINQQTRDLIAALKTELAKHGPQLPVYWGNRNWHPMLADTLLQMKQDGIQRALAFVTSAYSSYSGCRQYRENIARAQEDAGPAAPEIDKIRVFFNHPGFVDASGETACARRCSKSHRLREKMFRSSTSPTAFPSRWRTPATTSANWKK
jgi:ferrochelatase